jgi:hypothetical protein
VLAAGDAPERSVCFRRRWLADIPVAIDYVAVCRREGVRGIHPHASRAALSLAVALGPLLRDDHAGLPLIPECQEQMNGGTALLFTEQNGIIPDNGAGATCRISVIIDLPVAVFSACSSFNPLGEEQAPWERSYVSRVVMRGPRRLHDQTRGAALHAAKQRLQATSQKTSRSLRRIYEL